MTSRVGKVICQRILAPMAVLLMPITLFAMIAVLLKWVSSSIYHVTNIQEFQKLRNFKGEHFTHDLQKHVHRQKG